MIYSNKDINELHQLITEVAYEDALDERVMELDLVLESNTSPSTYLASFYQHFIKCMTQPKKFSRSWLESMNKSRKSINNAIRDGRGINTSQENELFANIEETFEIGRSNALDEMEDDVEAKNACKNFKAEPLFYDIKGFVFNTDKLIKYILSKMSGKKSIYYSYDKDIYYLEDIKYGVVYKKDDKYEKNKRKRRK